MALFAYEITKDNPGAYSFVKEACKINVEAAEKGFNRMRDNEIVGSQLWIFWNDCCGLNTELALELIQSDEIENIKKHINKAHEVIENRGIPYGT